MLYRGASAERSNPLVLNSARDNQTGREGFAEETGAVGLGDGDERAKSCHSGRGDSGFLQFRGDFLTKTSGQIDVRIVNEASGAKEESLKFGQFGLRPIEIGKRVVGLFDFSRWNNVFGSGVERSTIEKESERCKIGRAILFLRGEFAGDPEKMIEEFCFGDRVDSLERSQRAGRVRRAGSSECAVSAVPSARIASCRSRLSPPATRLQRIYS